MKSKFFLFLILAVSLTAMTSFANNQMESSSKAAYRFNFGTSGTAFSDDSIIRHRSKKSKAEIYDTMRKVGLPLFITGAALWLTGIPLLAVGYYMAYGSILVTGYAANYFAGIALLAIGGLFESIGWLMFAGGLALFIVGTVLGKNASRRASIEYSFDRDALAINQAFVIKI